MLSCLDVANCVSRLSDSLICRQIYLSSSAIPPTGASVVVFTAFESVFSDTLTLVNVNESVITAHTTKNKIALVFIKFAFWW